MRVYAYVQQTYCSALRQREAHAAGRVKCTSLMELRVFSRHSSELSSKVQWTYVSLSYEPRINNLEREQREKSLSIILQYHYDSEH